MTKEKLLLTKLRLRLGDMQSVNFSDYELGVALNSAASMLWIALAENFSSLPRKTVKLQLKKGGVCPLPKDFYTLVSLPPGAAVNGTHIKGQGKQVDLVYNRVPSSLEEVPLSLVLDVVEIAAAIAKGQTDAAVNAASASARRVSQKREHAGIPDRRPFS